MPRALRLQLAGGVFHVTSRGNRKHEIYINDSDRHIFLYALGKRSSPLPVALSRLLPDDESLPPRHRDA